MMGAKEERVTEGLITQRRDATGAIAFKNASEKHVFDSVECLCSRAACSTGHHM